ncbi:MAG: pentapeptide repeat-containing protein [Euryarchaeota archaeon]|nr:pentapeptide repeat-containing protein [Euryarchaeota archaeon]
MLNNVKNIKEPLLITIIVIFVLIFLLVFPIWQVGFHEINNVIIGAKLENQYLMTLVQALLGVTIIIGFYYMWRRVSIVEKELHISKDEQITECFTRAVDQLGAIDKFGKAVMEIRLGGIYALERISKESEKDYWTVMEILTAYVRKNSSSDIVENKKATQISMDIQANESKKSELPKAGKISLDIQAILTVIGRRIHSFNDGESTGLNLKKTYLKEADLTYAHLEYADLRWSHLERANLNWSHFERANLSETHLNGANLIDTKLEGAYLIKTYLEEAILIRSNLKRANLSYACLKNAILTEANLEKTIMIKSNLEKTILTGSNLEKANLLGVNFENANLSGANLYGTNLYKVNLDNADLRHTNMEKSSDLTIYQLLKAKTLYEAKFDEELRKSLKEKYPEEYQALIKKPV